MQGVKEKIQKGFAHLQRGKDWLKKYHYEEAIQELENASQILQDKEEIKNTLSEAREKDKKSKELFSQAQKAEKAREYEKAANLYQEYLNLCPEQEEAKLLLQGVKEKKRQQEYQKYLDKAKSSLQQGSGEAYQECIKECQNALSIMPQGKEAREVQRQCEDNLQNSSLLVKEIQKLLSQKNCDEAYTKAKEGLQYHRGFVFFLETIQRCEEEKRNEEKQCQEIQAKMQAKDWMNAFELAQMAQKFYPLNEIIQCFLKEIAKEIEKIEIARRKKRRIVAAVLLLVILMSTGVWKIMQIRQEMYENRKKEFTRNFSFAEKAMEEKEWSKAIAFYQKAKEAGFEDADQDWDAKIANAKKHAYNERKMTFEQNYALAEKNMQGKGWSKAIAFYQKAREAGFEDAKQDWDAKIANAKKQAYNERKMAFEQNYALAEKAMQGKKWASAIAFYQKAKEAGFEDAPKDWEKRLLLARQEEDAEQKRAEERRIAMLLQGRRLSSKSQDDRYLVLTSGIIIDTKTGMEWLVYLDKDTNWDEAKACIESIDSSKYGRGWRMPARKELLTIYKKGKGNSNIDTVFVSPRNWLFVWSGECDSSSSACFFDFPSGSELWYDRGFRGGARAFAVRAGSQ